MSIINQPCSVQRVTDGPFHHFFGYYEKTPWDAANRYILAHRVSFHHRVPTSEDIAVVGIVDTHNNNQWKPLAETTAWNLQQGSMLQWLGPELNRRIIFNSRTDAGYAATIVDIDTLERQVLPRPIYSVSADGRFAVTLNFSRFLWTRPVCGYPGIPDSWEGVNAPAEDGIYHLDLASGESHLIVSLASIVDIEPEPLMDGAAHWFNHLLLNPSGTRFTFLHRWKKLGQPRWSTRWFSANIDGSDIFLLGREHYISHFDWQDDHHLLAWMRHQEEDHYYLCTDRTETKEVIGLDVFQNDGHCTYSPDGQWILTDEYPFNATSERPLILYHLESNTRFNVGRFYSAPEITSDIRCDLHPRWSRNGQLVCIDSIHEGMRQMYVVDVSSIVDNG